jgi:hypothetical protein
VESLKHFIATSLSPDNIFEKSSLYKSLLLISQPRFWGFDVSPPPSITQHHKKLDSSSGRSKDSSTHGRIIEGIAFRNIRPFCVAENPSKGGVARRA